MKSSSTNLLPIENHLEMVFLESRILVTGLCYWLNIIGGQLIQLDRQFRG